MDKNNDPVDDQTQDFLHNLIKQSPAGRTFAVIPYYEKAKAYLDGEIEFEDIEGDMNAKSFPRKYFELFAENNKQVVPRGYQIAAKSKNAGVRKAVAKNPNCPEDLLRTLAKDEDYYVRGAVASNSNCPVDLLRTLAEGGNCARKAVASNPNCPEDLLRTLAKDQTDYVRGAAAKNPNCSEDLLRTLAKDGDADVRTAVAENPNCPEDLLRTLAKDGEFYVRAAAIASLKGCK
jgi:hypothetical protein